MTGNSSVLGNTRTSLYMEPHAWKLRRALQHKEMEQAAAAAAQAAAAAAAAAAERSDRSDRMRMIASQRPPSPREKLGLQGCPFDYVKNRIVEVMHQSSDEDGSKSTPSANANNGNVSNNSVNSSGSGGCSSSSASGGNSGTQNAVNNNADDSANEQTTSQQASSYLPASNYPYPYSALNINSQIPVPVPVSTHATPAPSITSKPVDVLEPTPILSAQYEPLSDED